MALPGFVDNRTGYVSNGGRFAVQYRHPGGAAAGRKMRLSRHLENDGKAAAMAELANGALKDCCNAAVFIIGTGVGGGIIANGQLVRRGALYRRGVQLCQHQRRGVGRPDQNMACQCSTSNLLKWYPRAQGTAGGRPAGRTQLFAAANAGEPEALEVLRRFCHAVAVQIYNPDRSAGCGKGGHRRRHQQAAPAAGKPAQRLQWTVRLPGGTGLHGGFARCQIVPCAFSSEANQVGVAAAYFEAMQKKR